MDTSQPLSTTRRVTVLFMLFIILMGVGVYRLLRPKIDVDAYTAQIKGMARQAAEQGDLSLCDTLPDQRSYLDRHPRDGKGIEEPSVWRVGHPREECRKEYTHVSTDPSVCELIKQYPDAYYTQQWCYRRMAEIYSEPNYCEKMAEVDQDHPLYMSGARIECEAIARLDASICEWIEVNKRDPLTTRGSCIMKVVARTHDVTPCLRIDRESDIPSSWVESNWQELRNRCIGSVAYQRQLLKQDRHDLCQMMSADTQTELPYRYKELCEKGYYMGYQLFSVGEIPIRLRQP